MAAISLSDWGYRKCSWLAGKDKMAAVSKNATVWQKKIIFLHKSTNLQRAVGYTPVLFMQIPLGFCLISCSSFSAHDFSWANVPLSDVFWPVCSATDNNSIEKEWAHRLVRQSICYLALVDGPDPRGHPPKSQNSEDMSIALLHNYAHCSLNAQSVPVYWTNSAHHALGCPSLPYLKKSPKLSAKLQKELQQQKWQVTFTSSSLSYLL